MTPTLKLGLVFFDPTDPKTDEEIPNGPAFRFTCEGSAATLAMFAQTFAQAIAAGRAEIVLYGPDGAGEVKQVDEANALTGSIPAPKPPGNQEVTEEITDPT